MSGLSRVRACDFELGPGSGFKMRPFCNSVWVCRQGPIRRDWKPTNSKNRLKSFCEVGYANFRPNIFVAGKRISMEILVGVGLHAWCPVASKRFVVFQKRKCARKYRLYNVKRFEQDIKSRCNSHFLQNAWTLKCSTLRVTCTCDQCDSAFCALQLTALIKPKWCVLLYCCACSHPNTMLMEAGWTTAPCPATNISILNVNHLQGQNKVWLVLLSKHL